jgi:hypothetical protein
VLLLDEYEALGRAVAALLLSRKASVSCEALKSAVLGACAFAEEDGFDMLAHVEPPATDLARWQGALAREVFDGACRHVQELGDLAGGQHVADYEGGQRVKPDLKTTSLDADRTGEGYSLLDAIAAPGSEEFDDPLDIVIRREEQEAAWAAGYPVRP